VSGLVLVAPAQPVPTGTRIDATVRHAFSLLAIPGLGGWLLRRRAVRLGAAGQVDEVLRLCCVDARRVPPDVVKAHVALAAERMRSMRRAHKAFMVAARSLMAELRSRQRFADLVAKVTAPTLLVHGTGDRLVPLAASRALAQLRPDWTLEVFEDIGHVPQLEAPSRFVDTVVRWLDGAGARAAVDAKVFA
jgi:pimeloyl-ACP methyl ester carboxylesterase